MKRNHLFFAAAAAILAFAACEPEETVGVPDIQVTPSSVSFQNGASSQTVTLTASRDWTVSGAPDWLAFDPSSGKASSSSQTVTITAMANPGYNRSADVTFTIGLMKAYVHVDQPGDKGVRDDGNGTLESPYTIAGVKAYIDGLENPSAESPKQVYIKGFVSSIGEAYTAQFGNGTFYITDEDGAETFYVYRALYLENKKFTAKDTQIQVGDEVVICGNVYLFGSSNPVYETVANKAFLYSLNGETKGYTQEEITASTVKDFIARADEGTYYRLTGTVSGFKTGTNTSGKDWMQFDLTDDTGTILVYGFNDGEFEKWAGVVKDRGTVTLTGTYQYYEKNKQHEVMNVTIESFEAGSEPGEITASTVADFIAKADKNTYYRLTGTVSEFKTGTNSSGKNWMQFNLADDTGSILVYGFKDGEYDKWATTVKDGGTITLTGTYEYYEKNKQHEVMNVTIESFEAGSEPGEITASTVADFIAKADKNTYYRLTGTVSEFKTGTNSSGKNWMQFNLADDTGSILVYGFKDGEYDKWATTVKDGGTITLTGTYEYYEKNKQHEVMNATIESFNGGEPGPEPPAPSEDVKAVTVAEFLAAPESKTQWYELTGTVSNIRSGNGEKYGNFDLTDATGTVYVYGLTSKKVDKNDQSFASLGIKEGDEITIITLRAAYNGDPQAGGTPPAYLKAGGGETPGGGETTTDFTSNVTWTSGSDAAAYDEKANVNGTSDVAVLKLGTSSKVGTSTLTLPAGSTSLTFYAVSWKGKPSKVVFSVDGKEVGSAEPAANDGLANQNPYTLTVTESDKYTITFDATSTLKVETSGSNTRVALFGIQAK